MTPNERLELASQGVALVAGLLKEASPEQVRNVCTQLEALKGHLTWIAEKMESEDANTRI